MVAIAERSPFTAEADKPLDLTRKAKKLANWMSEGEVDEKPLRTQ